MASMALKKVVDHLHSAKFYSVIADETTDSSNGEEVALCLRWVDKMFEAPEEPIGLYAMDLIGARIIVQVIKLRCST